MARNRSIIASVLTLSLFFALASARVPLDPTEDGVRIFHGSTDLLESEPKTTNTLLLPSDDPEPETIPEIEPDQVSDPRVSELTEPEDVNSNDEEASLLEAQTGPVRAVRLRPINRHYFPRRPMFVGRNRRGCRQHGGQLSYGDDMVLGGGGEKMMMGGGERQWARRFQKMGGPRFWIVRPNEIRPRGDGERRKEEDDEMRMIRPHHHHFHRFFHHPRGHHDEDGDRRPDEMDREHHHDHDRHHEHEMGGRGIFKGIRKFLNQF